MRSKKEFVRIAVEKSLYDELVKDRNHFQEVIGGGKWSLSDTIQELKKIANTLK